MSEEIVTRLYDNIEGKDVDGTLSVIQEMKEMVLSDVGIISWISAPVNLTELHKSLESELDIPHKLLMLRFRVTNKRKRAYVILDIIEKAIRKVYSV